MYTYLKLFILVSLLNKAVIIKLSHSFYNNNVKFSESILFIFQNHKTYKYMKIKCM